ncbi:MAG TPA: cytochrome c maturation protein CcmE [Stellaceae bacterium]|nr:cytochrome c maturation protein CcmE [Stellaceae bacterium]
MSRKRRRLIAVVAGLSLFGAAIALVLAAFSSDLVFFYSPSDLIARAIAPDHRIRIGGVVERDTLVRAADGKSVRFRITDGKTNIAVTYTGILPDLFREGQGVVAEGELLPDGVFAASTILAKHDAKYMPPEVAEALKKAGRWKEGSLPDGRPYVMPAAARSSFDPGS